MAPVGVAALPPVPEANEPAAPAKLDKPKSDKAEAEVTRPSDTVPIPAIQPRAKDAEFAAVVAKLTRLSGALAQRAQNSKTSPAREVRSQAVQNTPAAVRESVAAFPVD